MKFGITLIFGLGIFVAPAAGSQASSSELRKKELNKEHLDSVEVVDDAVAEIERLQHSIAVASRKRKNNCLKAFGSAKYCKCLDEHLPVVVDFPAYIRILILTKKDLGYVDATDEDKEIIDKTIQAREKCVQAGY